MTRARKPTAKAADKAAPAVESPAASPAAAASEPKARRRPAAKKAAAAPATPPPSPRTTSELSALEIAAALNAERAASDATPPSAVADARVVSWPSTANAERVAREAAPDARPHAGPADATTDALDDAAAAAANALLPLADRVRLRQGTADLLVFRVGTELFGAALTAIEEAVELPQLSHLPEMPPSMLGVISLRGRMLPAYSPARPLGVALARADAAALVVRVGERRLALAVDDVDDVLTVDLSELRPPPIVAGEERDAVLLGVASRDGALVSVLDADALVTACLSDQALETV